eukprot:m.394987 g.394987  ORF g.394987 m.394987 type:complete len:130 (-) comp56382_c0_seq2:76-465(-)
MMSTSTSSVSISPVYVRVSVRYCVSVCMSGVFMCVCGWVSVCLCRCRVCLRACKGPFDVAPTNGHALQKCKRSILSGSRRQDASCQHPASPSKHRPSSHMSLKKALACDCPGFFRRCVVTVYASLVPSS